MRFLAALQFLILKTEGALEHFKNLSSSSPVFTLSKHTIFRQSHSLATVLLNDLIRTFLYNVQVHAQHLSIHYMSY
jgi:hypothetical protein